MDPFITFDLKVDVTCKQGFTPSDSERKEQCHSTEDYVPLRITLADPEGAPGRSASQISFLCSFQEKLTKIID